MQLLLEIKLPLRRHLFLLLRRLELEVGVQAGLHPLDEDAPQAGEDPVLAGVAVLPQGKLPHHARRDADAVSD